MEVQDDFHESRLREVQSSYILHWNYRNLKCMPKELLDHGEHIQEIYLKENQIQAIPERLDRLSQLTNIYLFGNNLKEFPISLIGLKALRVLDLGGNGLEELPNDIGEMTGLQTLDLSTNLLRGLPPDIGKLVNLEYLVAYKNRLTSLPRTLSQWKALKSLQVSGNLLRELPKELEDCRNLTDIYVERNLLTHIPLNITTLPKLARLNASSNHLKYLPSLPFVSHPRLTFDFNHDLCHIPFHLGCFQTFLSYQTIHSLENQRCHIRWKFRNNGCFKSREKPKIKGGSIVKTVLNNENIFLHLPINQCCLFNGRDQVRFSNQTVPSLLELCLRYNFASFAQCQFRKDEISLLGLQIAERLPRERFAFNSLASLLPRNVIQLLRNGPQALCCEPKCTEVMFDWIVLAVIEVDLKGGIMTYLDEGEEESEAALSSIMFCSTSCLGKYLRQGPPSKLQSSLSESKYIELS
ncbi:hypothetical protein TCAL_10296 [Tigriopus californicus]|uniref:Disease resistance R13L4/SHOC-2-like LRR domain-containing protein n=1 Tax=Tigriopus californicus TaxID=6832 RepID=A0A553NYL2_TIGCA|nr:protein lap1-like [Tigriopus californicus]TRY70515.1 hypothetical protein TCAL_10296 [Tigriopus californicus]|eukprot:TCALIF_10296-PA protein Name:"Similar to lrrc28 Leucine-rich repeat-containing protein 28 (Xenopus tropicalis)" AED:0.22 eAED:0.22 QI:170/1/0.5/1/1/1/2/0/465